MQTCDGAGLVLGSDTASRHVCDRSYLDFCFPGMKGAGEASIGYSLRCDFRDVAHQLLGDGTLVFSSCNIFNIYPLFRRACGRCLLSFN